MAFGGVVALVGKPEQAALQAFAKTAETVVLLVLGLAQRIAQGLASMSVIARPQVRGNPQSLLFV